MAINGTHMLFYTTEAEKLRAMLRDVFGFTHVDAGGGWLIFAMPPAEIGVHPAEGPSWDAGARHLISFMCDDITKTIADLRAKGVNVDPQTKEETYGITTNIHLPGGCDVTLYEPRHAIAAAIPKKKSAAKKAARKKPAKKKSSPRPARRAKKAARRR
jgi:hypothetical protein